MTPIVLPDSIDLIIFDCDGVLIDSEMMACATDAQLLTEAGYPITGEEMAERFAGIPSETVYATVAAEIGRALPDDLEDRFKAVMVEEYRTELNPIPGIAQALATLPHAKCVASSSTPAKLALGLIETDLYESFYPNIYSTALVARGKPHPDIFLYAAEKMGVPANKCLVVEDSVAGVAAARAAGMACIGFTGGSHCAPGHDARLREVGAVEVISMMSLLPATLGIVT